MNKEEILTRLQEVFRDVFDDEELEISEETVPDDVEGWDSLGHIQLINGIEHEFAIKFGMDEIMKLRDVRQIVDCIAAM